MAEVPEFGIARGLLGPRRASTSRGLLQPPTRQQLSRAKSSGHLARQFSSRGLAAAAAPPPRVRKKSLTVSHIAATADVRIYITNLNDCPVFPAQTFVLAENAAAAARVGMLGATDEDGDALVYTLGSALLSV